MKKQNFIKKVKNNAQNTKQNQDFPNVPQTPKSEGTSEINKNQIKKALFDKALQLFFYDGFGGRLGAYFTRSVSTTMSST